MESVLAGGLWPRRFLSCRRGGLLKSSSARRRSTVDLSPVAFSILQRLTACLCLAVALLTGITPAQGLVLCLEPDGCVSVEIAAADQGCESCEDHEEPSAPAEVATPTTDEAHCPCLDLPLFGSSQERRVRPEQAEAQLGPWIAAASLQLAWTLPVVPLLVGAPRTDAAHPPGSLARIRSVVLLV